ncbi:hypothetical protein H6F86_08425 [Phormidium sp. FACHB-592]|uniref:DUF1156 domain-containing protein n=1 Tax=Stenomitos frigidus AS-A4 TaxID=2933935 RepID=A0ABV0KRF0_9CYAN|nr:hypothetical protein [Phormidium sp. FACHB-592]MBD2073913.1 hypothetical protein [Phormidium sp. FACHB-592]
MTDPKPDRKSVFIEKIMPVTLLNEQVYYEHSGNPFKGLHRWYLWKPLSFSQASVLGSLLLSVRFARSVGKGFFSAIATP